MESVATDINIFEQIKNRGEKFGRDFWWAREVAEVLDYNWYDFETLISRALQYCHANNVDIKNHFAETNKITFANGEMGHLRDAAMSKYFTHRVVENAVGNVLGNNVGNAGGKERIIQLAQAYFNSPEPIKDEELEEQAKTLYAEKQQVSLREAVAKHNRILSGNAKAVGVRDGVDYMEFNKAGFMGLYGGMTPTDIKESMHIPVRESIYDHIGVKELAANEKRIIRASTKLETIEPDSGLWVANQVHNVAGKSVRCEMEWTGEIPPERMPMAKKSVQQIQSKLKKAENALKNL
ncbi:MAG: hypothetical protein LBQ05_03105 [Christensenellaceae bacterium]|jgi:DNA-damage-inducible protein D|nr:hypothetical protein [Christensenellaceae bacterium]